MTDQLVMNYVERKYFDAWCGDGNLPAVSAPKIDAAMAAFRQKYGSTPGVGQPTATSAGFEVPVTEDGASKLPDEFEGFVSQLVAD